MQVRSQNTRSFWIRLKHTKSCILWFKLFFCNIFVFSFLAVATELRIRSFCFFFSKWRLRFALLQSVAVYFCWTVGFIKIISKLTSFALWKERIWPSKPCWRHSADQHDRWVANCIFFLIIIIIISTVKALFVNGSVVQPELSPISTSPLAQGTGTFITKNLIMLITLITLIAYQL